MIPISSSAATAIQMGRVFPELWAGPAMAKFTSESGQLTGRYREMLVTGWYAPTI
jgi:hypothetical protein